MKITPREDLHSIGRNHLKYFDNMSFLHSWAANDCLSGFELRSSGVGNERYSCLATTTALNIFLTISYTLN